MRGDSCPGCQEFKSQCHIGTSWFICHIYFLKKNVSVLEKTKNKLKWGRRWQFFKNNSSQFLRFGHFKVGHFFKNFFNFAFFSASVTWCWNKKVAQVFQKLPKKWSKQFDLKKQWFSQVPLKSPNIWATFVIKVIAKKFQKSHTLFTLFSAAQLLCSLARSFVVCDPFTSKQILQLQ